MASHKAETPSSSSGTPPEKPDERKKVVEGADSMLRCYNATEWRLEDWFDDEPAPPKKSS